MIKKISNLSRTAIIAMAVIIVIGGVTVVQAWTNNSLAPVGGSVLGPIVSGVNAQTKIGDLSLGGDVTVRQGSNIGGNVTMLGGLRLSKNTNNCNLRVNGSGSVECAGISATVTGPHNCNGGGGGSGGYCDLPGPASQQCFLTKIEAWGSDIDAYDCNVFYDSGSSKWRMHYWGDDISGINCQAICLQ